MECYENKGDAKPVKTLELQWEDEEEEEGIFSKCWAKVTGKAAEEKKEEEEEDDKKGLCFCSIFLQHQQNPLTLINKTIFFLEGAEVCTYKEVTNAFEVQTDDGDWQLQAQNYVAREEWMSWIGATAAFNERLYAKQEARKLPKEEGSGKKKGKKEKAEKRKSTSSKKEKAEEKEEKMEEIPLDDAEKKKKRKSKREE